MSALPQTLSDFSIIGREQILPVLWEDIFPPGLLNELHAHPFLAVCRKGEATRELLSSFLIQHQYYSQYFTRYLCAMMASLPDQEDVKALAGNLFEEMGLDGAEVVTHAELYLESMAAIGVIPRSQPMFIATRNLIDAMFRYCRSIDPLEGLAALCLGAEAIVPVVYDAILSGLKRLGIPAKGLTFFELHVAEDEAHAIVMRQIIDRLLKQDSASRARVLAIGEDMVRLRMAMLSAILQNYQRQDSMMKEVA